MFSNIGTKKLWDETSRRIMLPLAIALALLLVGIILQLRRRFRQAKIINSNGMPICELTKDARIDKFVHAAALSQKGRDLAGDQPFLIWNGSQRELVITKPEHVREFYRGDNSMHPKPKNLHMGEYFGQILGQAVGVKDGERWRVVRKHFDPVFAQPASRQALWQLHAGVAEWCKELPRHALDSSESHVGFDCDVQTLCRFLPFKLMAANIYGDAFNDKVYSELLHLNSLHETILHDVIASYHLASKWGRFDFAARRRVDQYNRQWDSFNMGLIYHARAHNLDCPAERVYRGTESVPALTKTEFLHTMDEILFANIDVSAAVLYTMFDKLASVPTTQEKLRHELHAQALQTENGWKKYISNQNSLLHRVVLESMRFSPAFAFSLPECTSTAKIIGGFQIPADTAVIIDAVRLNSNKDTWGPTAAEFQPERFENISPQECRHEMMRFGVGANSGRCLGKHFADAIFKLAAGCVVRDYEIRMSKVGQKGLLRLVRV